MSLETRQRAVLLWQGGMKIADINLRFKEEGWRTPPESPDLNPIENVWGSLKRFLRDYHKPHNQASLINGIKIFWKTLTPQVCRKYINHVHKVIPKVIEEKGGPSGY